MAVLLAWISWQHSEPTEQSWRAMLRVALARSPFPGEEHSGPGWRIYSAPTRPGETPVEAADAHSLYLLDRAPGPRLTPGSRAIENLLIDGGPCAGIALDTNTHRCSLFRDAMGQRSLVYALIPGGVIAASGERILAAHPAVSTDLDEDFLAAYLCALPPAHGASAFRQIRTVAAGETLALSASGEKGQRICVEPTEDGLGLSDAGIVDRFGELLQGAVARATLGAEKVGVSLSAGIDSACVAAALPQGQPAVAVTYGFPSWPQIDEGPLAREIANALGIPHRLVEADELRPLCAQLQRPINPDTPLASIYRELKEGAYQAFTHSGATTWVDGNFGDHLGRIADDWIYAGWRDRRWQALRREFTWRRSADRRWWHDRGMRNLARRMMRRSIVPPQRLNWLEPGKRHVLRDRWLAELDRYRHFPRPLQAMNCLNAYAMASASGEHFYAHRHRMEQVSPFRNLELTRWMLSLPDDLHHRHGIDKWLMRRWLERHLPSSVTRRPKSSDLTPFLASSIEQDPRRWTELTDHATGWAAKLCSANPMNSTVDDQLLRRWLSTALGLWLFASGDA